MEFLRRHRERIRESAQPNVVFDLQLKRPDAPYIVSAESQEMGDLLREYDLSEKNIKKLLVYFKRGLLFNSSGKEIVGEYNVPRHIVTVSIDGALKVANQPILTEAYPDLSAEEIATMSLNHTLRHEFSHVLFDVVPKQKGYSYRNLLSEDIHASIEEQLMLSGNQFEKDLFARTGITTDQEAKARGMEKAMARSGRWQDLAKITRKS